MSDPNLPDAPQNVPPMARRTARTVELRQESAEDDPIAMLEPGAKALAEALRLTYRVLQLAMVVIAGWFLLSGLTSVNEGERGIRVTFGKPVGDELSPGFHFSWPEPVGEVINVSTGATSLSLGEEFWPKLTGGMENRPTQELAGGPFELDPESDGSNLTADGSLAHTKWAVTYRKWEPREVEQNIHPDHLEEIIRAAVQRGVNHATTSLSIDELLKNTPDEDRSGLFRPAAEIAQAVAQGTLDSIGSGVRIESLVMEERIPTRASMNAFSEVQSGQSEAGKLVEDARAEQDEILKNAAGEAAPYLLALIDRYEVALELGDDAAGDEALVMIDALLDSEPIEWNGRVRQVAFYGNASTMLQRAKQEQEERINTAVQDLELFQAKLPSFKSDAAQVLINRDWAAAFTAFLSRDTVQIQMLPADTRDLVVLLNRDPQLARMLEAERYKAQMQQTLDANRRARQSERIRNDYDSNVTPIDR